MDNKAWLEKQLTILQVMTKQLEGAQNVRFGMEGRHKADKLEKILQGLFQDIQKFDSEVLKEKGHLFTNLAHFTADPSNLEQPNRISSFFYTSPLQIKQDQFLNELQLFIEDAENLRVENLSQSLINFKMSDLIVTAIPEILSEFHFSIFQLHKQPTQYASKLFLREIAPGKFLHQISTDNLNRKCDSIQNTNEVILSMIIECGQNSKRSLTIKLMNQNTCFAVPDTAEADQELGYLLQENTIIELSPSQNLIIDDVKPSQNANQKPILKNQMSSYLSFRIVPNAKELNYLQQNFQFYNSDSVTILPSTGRIERKKDEIEVLDKSLADKFFIQRTNNNYYISKTSLNPQNISFFPKVQAKEITLTENKSFSIILNNDTLISIKPITNWITVPIT